MTNRNDIIAKQQAARAEALELVALASAADRARSGELTLHVVEVLEQGEHSTIWSVPYCFKSARLARLVFEALKEDLPEAGGRWRVNLVDDGREIDRFIVRPWGVA